MKKLFRFILALVLVASCTQREDIIPPDNDTSTTEEKPQEGEDEQKDNEPTEEEPPSNPEVEFINFPDATFKAYLLSNFDSNSDGEISPEEALQAKDITVTTDNIETLKGIEYFLNLETLSCNGYRDQDRNIMGRLKDTLNLSGLKQLRSLECRHNHLEVIRLHGNSALKSIVAYGNSLVELNLNGAPALESVDAGDCMIKQADASGCLLLTTLYVHNNQLTELDLRQNVRLEHLTCDRNPLTRIILRSGQSIPDMRTPDGVEIVYDQDAPPLPSLGTGLRSVYIQYSGTITKDKWQENGTISIVDDAGKVYFQSDSLSIKGRGNSTWSYPKKPYKIKLKAKEDLLGHGKSKRYVLLANWMDRTLLRNDVSFELARKTSLPWTPSGEFVELYLNGVHQGNYWFGEQIRVEKHRVQADYLIEMDTYYDETWKFMSSKGYKPNTNNYGLPIGVKYPDDDDLTSVQFQEVKNLVAGVENAIYNGGDYASKINLDSFLDWYLVHEITYNLEPNHPKSCFFHFNNGVMIAGPVWDFDWYTYQPSTSGLAVSRSIYFDELFKIPAVNVRLKERWKELRPKFLEVDSYIVAKAEEIRKSDAINNSMWPCTSTVNGDQSMSFDNSVSRMRKALRDRITEVDSKLQ